MSSISRRQFVQIGAAAGISLGVAHEGSAGPKAHAPSPSWLVMLYLAGDNNLTEDMVLALQDLIAAGPIGNDKMVAQLDPSARGLATQTYDFSNFKKPDGSDKKYIEDFLICRTPESDTGSVASLRSFITWAVQTHGAPDVRYLLILSGHGSGITEDFFLSDAGSMDSLTICELENALRDIQPLLAEKNNNQPKKIDILGMDACYMAMGEIAYQVRGSVDIMVGAEGLEPEFGWPYRRILAEAKANYGNTHKVLEPEELAALIVDKYVDNYSEYDQTAGRSADLAAIRLTTGTKASGEVDRPSIDAVAESLKGLTGVLQNLSEADHKKLLLAHWYAQTYKYDQYVDLKDLCAQIQTEFPDQSSPIWHNCAQVMTAIDGCVIRSGCSGFACQYSYGFSIYFPWSYVSPDYGNVAFASDTTWPSFLEQHVIATRRVSRYKPDTFFPVLAPTKSHAEVETARQKLLDELLSAANAPANAELLTIVNRVGRLRNLAPVAGDRVEAREDRIKAVAHAVAASDIPTVDVPRELTRRFLRRSGVGPAGSRHTENAPTSRYSERSRYAERSRYSEHSRYVEDRETWVKNLPPEVGTAYFPA